MGSELAGLAPETDVPALVVCAHGTNDDQGQRCTLAIRDAVRASLPGVEVEAAYVDVQQPTLDDEVSRLVAGGRRVVVVPVLLSTGFHVQVDVRRAVEAHPGRVASAGPLGPDARLADVLCDRLREAGVTEGTPVVVAVAGSRRPDAQAAARQVSDDVAQRWHGPVTHGFLAAAQPLLPDAVAAARAAHPGAPVAVGTYLTGPGYFLRQAQRAGADATTAPLADHPLLVEVIVQRYREAAASL